MAKYLYPTVYEKLTGKQPEEEESFFLYDVDDFSFDFPHVKIKEIDWAKEAKHGISIAEV